MHVIISKWAPPDERSVLSAIIYAGKRGQLAAARNKYRDKEFLVKKKLQPMVQEYIVDIQFSFPVHLLRIFFSFFQFSFEFHVPTLAVCVV